MSLNFPNPSRSFDREKNLVIFWGYDSAIEVVFFVDVLALKKLAPKMGEIESDILEEFDNSMERIREVANANYKGKNSKSYAYHLTAKDF